MEIETDSMMHVFGSMILIDAGVDPGFSDRERGVDKCLPTLSNCYNCCLTSPFFTRKSMVKILFCVCFT